jgi:hypothetical protein
MSFQIALMAGMAAMSVAQAASQAKQGADAMGRGIQSAQKAQEAARTETYLQGLQTQVRGSQYLTQASQTDITQSEPNVREAQQELQRRRALDQLMQSNAIDLVARGGVQTGQDSASAIDDRNRAMTEEDISSMRFMSESQKRQLSFRKQNLEMAAQGEELRGLYAQAGGQNKIEAGDRQIADLGARAQDIGTNAMFTIGKTLLSSAGSFGGGKTDPRDVYSGDRTGGLA